MNDFQLKLILSILAGIMFSFIFILLAFSLPSDTEEQKIISTSKVEQTHE